MRLEAPGYIVDTNVISSKVTFEKHPNVSRWLLEYAELIRISVISMAEIAKGLNASEKSITREREGEDKQRRLRALAEKRDWQNELATSYTGKMEPIDLRVATKWAEISTRFPQLRDGDQVILATAIVNGYSIATRNLRVCPGSFLWIT